MNNVNRRIFNELMKKPGSKATGDNQQIRMVCPKCRHDSAKLYIGVMMNSETLGYHCKHCPFSGRVTETFLKLFDIDSSLIEEYNQKTKSNSNSKHISNPITKIRKLDIKFPSNTKIQQLMRQYPEKIKYLNTRFNRTITVDDVRFYKIVLDLQFMLEYNKIDYINSFQEEKDREKAYYFLQEFTNNFVGFLSFDNNKIIFRNIDSKRIRDKYMHFNIDKTINNPFLYTPDIPIDIMSDNPVIVMTEGVFDIIGVKERYYLNEDYNIVFAAVNGKGSYKRALYQIMKMTGFVDAEVIIYADNDGLDVNNDIETNKSYMEANNIDMVNILKNELLFVNKLKIYYNTLGKDYGDLRESVKLMEYRIK